MALIAFGVVASTAYKRSYLGVQLSVGQTAQLGRWDLTYEGLGAEPSAGEIAYYARMVLSRGNRVAATLLPAVASGSDQATAAGPTYIPAIHEGIGGDVYVVLAGYQPGGAQAIFNAFLDPLVGWIWAGGALLVAGSLFSLWPRRAVLVSPRSSRVFSLWSELEYDHRMGKTTTADYQLLRARYAAEAEEALRSEGGGRAGDLAGMEARIRARVAELAARQAGPEPELVGAGRAAGPSGGAAP